MQKIATNLNIWSFGVVQKHILGVIGSVYTFFCLKLNIFGSERIVKIG